MRVPVMLQCTVERGCAKQLEEGAVTRQLMMIRAQKVKKVRYGAQLIHRFYPGTTCFLCQLATHLPNKCMNYSDSCFANLNLCQTLNIQGSGIFFPFQGVSRPHTEPNTQETEAVNLKYDSKTCIVHVKSVESADFANPAICTIGTQSNYKQNRLIDY